MYAKINGDPDSGRVVVTLPMFPDFRMTYSGSALPFPSERVAFAPSQTPFQAQVFNRVVDLSNARAPNPYYRDGVLGAPRARVSYVQNGRSVVEYVDIRGVPTYPGRTLTHARRTYTTTRDMPVETQDRIFVESAARWPALGDESPLK